MKVDMHIHTFRSVDSVIIRKDVEKVISKGIIDLVAITDHDSAKGWDDFKDMNVIRGIEKTIIEEDGNEFHLLIYFANEYIESKNFYEVVDAAKAQDAIVSIAHPFDILRKAPKNINKYIKHVDG
ncbi:MAG: PHP domain-containing protein, partial [Candidatus Kryptoniota bacterium]